MADNRNSESLNMQNLKQDAIRRARDMQSRARIPPYSPPAYGGPGQNPAEQTPARQARPEANTPHPHGEEMPIHPAGEAEQGETPLPDTEGTLDFLFKNSERTLILLLMLILLDEKSDTGLIFGFLYLLL